MTVENTLMIIVLSLGSLLMVTIGVIIKFWRPISNTFKLKQLARKGYGIHRFIDGKNVIEEVLKIKENFQYGADKKQQGLYVLDRDAVLLRDGIIQEYTFNKNNSFPYNYTTEIVSTTTNCPECKKPITLEYEKEKGINPELMDALALKMKTEGGIMAFLKEHKQIIMYCLISAGLAGVAGFLIYDLANNTLPKALTALGDRIIEKLSTAIVNGGTKIVA